MEPAQGWGGVLSALWVGPLMVFRLTFRPWPSIVMDVVMHAQRCLGFVGAVAVLFSGIAVAALADGDGDHDAPLAVRRDGDLQHRFSLRGDQGGFDLPFVASFGLGISAFSFDRAGLTSGAATGDIAGTLRGGVTFWDRLGVEVDYSVFSSNEVVQTTSVSSTTGAPVVQYGAPDALTAAYARGDWPLLGDVLRVHARAGFARLDIENHSASSALLPDDDNGLAVGVGAQLALGRHSALRLDMGRIAFDQADADAFTLGFSARF